MGFSVDFAKEKYLAVRGAQTKGARTLEELKAVTDIQIESEHEQKEIEKVLKNCCKCKDVSIEEVVKAVKDGANTVEKVGEATGAGTACGRCKNLIKNIIETGR